MSTSQTSYTKHKLTQIVDRIRDYRFAKDYSQRELARRSGVAYITIAKAESGEQNYSIATIIRLSKALNVSLSDLFRDL